MKYPMLSRIKHAILAIAIALAISHSIRTDLSAFHPADSSQQPAAESCTTVRPGPDWTCANGNWYPPGMPIPGVPTPPPPPNGAGCTTPDPFTSLGGGTCCNGDWLPPGMACGAPPSPGPQDRSLVGVWLVQITPRNCATGDPIPTAAFEALYTFHEDKTMLVSLRNNTLTLERTAAHGLWRRDLGVSDYSFKFVHIRRNVATGAFAGYQEGAGTLVLADSGDEFTTDGSTAMGCSNSVGTRFKLEP